MTPNDDSDSGLQRPSPSIPDSNRAMPGDGVLLVLTTVDSAGQAERIARQLVDERLAACVTQFAGARSVYRWQGSVETADEVVLLIKTTRKRYAALEQRVLELHPYELPELVALAPDRLLPAYAGWVIGETRQPIVRRDEPAP